MNEQSKFKFISIILFILIVFWPVLVCCFVYGLGEFLNLFVSPFPEASRRISLGFIIEGFIPVFLPIFIILVAYYLCSHTKKWINRGWILYSSWLILMILAGFYYSSLYAWEGSYLNRHWFYFKEALKLSLFAHIFIVPWVIISVYLLKLFQKKGILWKMKEASQPAAGTVANEMERF